MKAVLVLAIILAHCYCCCCCCPVPLHTFICVCICAELCAVVANAFSFRLVWPGLAWLCFVLFAGEQRTNNVDNADIWSSEYISLVGWVIGCVLGLGKGIHSPLRMQGVAQGPPVAPIYDLSEISQHNHNNISNDGALKRL